MKNTALRQKQSKKEIRGIIAATSAADEREAVKQHDLSKMSKKERDVFIEGMEHEMKEAAKALDFERAAELRDALLEIKAEG